MIKIPPENIGCMNYYLCIVLVQWIGMVYFVWGIKADETPDCIRYATDYSQSSCKHGKCSLNIAVIFIWLSVIRTLASVDFMMCAWSSTSWKDHTKFWYSSSMGNTSKHNFWVSAVQWVDTYAIASCPRNSTDAIVLSAVCSKWHQSVVSILQE